jgi:hypothetical protein
MRPTAGSVPARVVAILVLTVAVGVGTGRSVWAQAPPSGVLRLALLPQWTVQQHRVARGQPNASLRAAVESGVVDRTVFAWQRGIIQRQALVWKPIRLLADPEASALGGRGQFSLVAIRPPAGRAAWTELEVSRSAPRADDVLLLEIGGERNTMTQVLETLLVADPARGLVEVPLARTALIPGGGVPVVAAPFEQPLPPALAERFREVAGLGLLVVRSPLWDVRDGDVTPSGPADSVPFSGGDWREGDRVFLRIPAGALDRSAPALVLGWKDRTLKSDPDMEFPRRSALPFPLVR